MVVMIRKSALFGSALSLPVMLLCPGYYQVTQFRPDNDYEEEQEIFYATLKLGNVKPILILNCDSYHLVVSTFSVR